MNDKVSEEITTIGEEISEPGAANEAQGEQGASDATKFIEATQDDAFIDGVVGQAPLASGAESKSEPRENPLPESADVSGSVADSMEELAGAVLDAADVANQSAHTAAKATHNLLDAVSELERAGQRGQRMAMYVMAGASGLLLVALIVFISMASSLNNRMKRVDVMLMAVAARVIEMDTGLNAIHQVQQSIADFYNVQSSFREGQSALEKRVESIAVATEAMAAQIPERTAMEVGLRNDELGVRVGQLELAIEAQQASSAELDENMRRFVTSVGSMERKIGSVERLNRDVSSLVTLQRERYLESVQAQRPAREAPAEDVFVTYQRPSADAVARETE